MYLLILCYLLFYMYYRSEGVPRTGYFIPGRGGMGVWAAQEIQCRRRVARPPVGAFPENVFGGTNRLHMRDLGASMSAFCMIFCCASFGKCQNLMISC